MTTLHVITGLRGGGAEHQLFHLLEGGLAHHPTAHVLSLTDRGVLGDRIERLGVPVHTLCVRNEIDVMFKLMQFRRLLRRIRPTIVQGWMYHGNLAAWLARRLTTWSPVVTWNVQHALCGLQTEKRTMRTAIRANRLLSDRVDALLYASHTARHQHEAFGFSAARSVVIPNGFDLSKFSPQPEVRDRMRAEIGLPLDAVVVGHMARLHPMKNHAGFLRAAIRVAAQNDTMHCLLVGRGVERWNAELSQLIPDDLQTRFHLIGERDDIPDVMRTLDVLCQSSSWGDASANVLGEAMASGVPCVTTDVGDSADVVAETGLVVPVRDEDALVGALQQLVSMPATQRRQLGESARQRVKERFDMHRAVARYRSLYQSLSGK
jgi:glycosyltransferase involved in cell wall biosynthesis